jgi:hypothetical protein
MLIPPSLADKDEKNPPQTTEAENDSAHRQRKHVKNEGRAIFAAKSIENAASSMFVLGSRPIPSERRLSNTSQHSRPNNLPGLSKQVTIGRNSQFHDLTAEDAEKLGGTEYAALKLLLKIVCGNYDVLVAVVTWSWV